MAPMTYDKQMSDEEKQKIQSLQAVACDGLKLQEMVATPGWQEVLVPMMTRWKEAKIQEMLSTAHKHEAFLLLQQSINAADIMLKQVDLEIAKGAAAEEQLKEKQSES